jgi:hypothetical protein
VDCAGGRLLTRSRTVPCAEGASPAQSRPEDCAEGKHHPPKLYLSDHKQGLLYGCGIIEAGGKAVIGQRLKQSGMFWSEAGARSLLDLR